MVTDPIADFLTRIRNAQMARHRIVEIPASIIKKRITEILYEKGYILKYKFEDDNKQGTIKIALKYDPETKEPAIKALERISRPGLRQYAKPAEIRHVQNGLGIAIISTSKGVSTSKDLISIISGNKSAIYEEVMVEELVDDAGKPAGQEKASAKKQKVFSVSLPEPATIANDLSFEKQMKQALDLLPAKVQQEAAEHKAPIIVVEHGAIVRINPDKTKETIGKIEKTPAKIKIRKIMPLD